MEGEEKENRLKQKEKKQWINTNWPKWYEKEDIGGNRKQKTIKVIEKEI